MLSPILCRLCCCCFVHAGLWIERIPSVLLLLFLQLHQTCMLHSDAATLTKETALWAQREGNIFEEGSGCPVVLAKTWVSICPLAPVPLCFVLCGLHTLCWVTVGGNSGSSQLCDSPQHAVWVPGLKWLERMDGCFLGWEIESGQPSPLFPSLEPTNRPEKAAHPAHSVNRAGVARD